MLYFGCHSQRTDFLYKNELNELKAVLPLRIHVAASREPSVKKVRHWMDITSEITGKPIGQTDVDSVHKYSREKRYISIYWRCVCTMFSKKFLFSISREKFIYDHLAIFVLHVLVGQVVFVGRAAENGAACESPCRNVVVVVVLVMS